MTNPHISVFIVGPPGVGKTSAVRQILGSEFVNFTHPESSKVKWCLQKNGPWVFAGHYGVGTFDGGDTVPNDGWLPCMEYWEKGILTDSRYRFTLFDGDRFSHSNCHKFLEDRGVRVLCVHMTASDEVLWKRRRGRGSDQNPTWLKGRTSKARNFADRFLSSGSGILDMFSSEEVIEEGKGRLLDIFVEGLSPSDVAFKIADFVDS